MIPFPSLAPLANSPPPSNNSNTSRKNRSMSALRSLSPSTTTSNNTSSSSTTASSTPPPPPPARERSKSDSSTSVLHTPSNDNTNTRSSLDSPHPLQQQLTNPSINVHPPKTPSNSISQSPSSQQLQSSALAKGLIAASVTGVVPPLVASPISSPTFSPSSNNSASQSPSHTRPSTAEPEKQTLNSTVTATNASPQQIQQLLQTIQDANENSFSGSENGTSPARAATVNVAGSGFPTLGRANKSVENLPRPTEGVGVIPLVAKQSKNQQFHSIFRSVPDQEFLIEDFSCALQKEILVQGRLYVSENHICFHASILGWITTVMVPFTDVIAIEKRVTALIFPNAIEVITERQKYFFASFIFRELAFNLLTSLWRKANPAAASRTQTLPANLSHPLHSKDEFDSDPGVKNGDKNRKRDASRSKSRHRSKSRSRRNTEEHGKGNGTGERGRSAGKRQRRRRSYSDPSDNDDDVSDGSTTGSESDSRTGQSYDSQSIYSTEGSSSESEEEEEEDGSYISLKGSGSDSDNELEDEEVSVSEGEASSGGYKTESDRSDFASDGDQDGSNTGNRNGSKMEKGKSNSDSSLYSLSAVGAGLKLNGLDHSHTAHSSTSSLEQASPPPQFHSLPHRHRHPRTNSHSRFHSDSGTAPSTTANNRLGAITHEDGVKDVSVSDSGYSYVAKTLVKSESRTLGHGRSKSGSAVEAGLKGGSENEPYSGNTNQTIVPTDNTLHPIPTTKPRSGTLPSSFPPSSSVPLTTSPQDLHGDVEEVPLVFKSPVPCDPKCYCPSNVPVTIVMEEVVEGVTVKDIWELVYRDESLCVDYQESDETGMKEGKGFLKRFLEKKQGLKEIEPTKWESLDDGKKARKMKYLMPLAYPIGPKQTKVLYSEEVVEMDLESKLIIRATSQTPDVPSGTSFSTITIIGVTYTTPTSIKLTVATYVAWTKSSWFKGAVESGAVEGNTKYYKNLVAELRMWIKQYGRSIPVADGKKNVQDRRTRKPTKETETEEGDDRINRKSRRRRNDVKSTSKRKRTKSVTSPTTTSPETSPHPLLSTILGSFQSYLFPSSTTTQQIPQPSPPKTKSRRKSSTSKGTNDQKSPKSSTHRSKSSKTKRKSSTSSTSPPHTLLQSLQSMTLQNILNVFLLFLILGNIWVGVWMWKVSTLLDNVVQDLEKVEHFRHEDKILSHSHTHSESGSGSKSGSGSNSGPGTGTVVNGNESLNSNSNSNSDTRNTNTQPLEPQSTVAHIVNEVYKVNLQNELQNDFGGGGNGVNVNDARSPSGEVSRSEL